MPDISSNRSGSTGTRGSTGPRAAGGSRRAAGRDGGPRQAAPRGARAFVVRVGQLSVLALVVLPFALVVGGGLLALVVVLLTSFG